MPEPNSPPVEHFDKDTQTGLQYATGHLVSQTGREIAITFFIYQYPPKNNKVISQIILSPLHAQELAINVNQQLAKLKSGNDPKNEEPPSRF